MSHCILSDCVMCGVDVSLYTVSLCNVRGGCLIIVYCLTVYLMCGVDVSLYTASLCNVWGGCLIHCILSHCVMCGVDVSLYTASLCNVWGGCRNVQRKRVEKMLNHASQTVTCLRRKDHATLLFAELRAELFADGKKKNKFFRKRYRIDLRNSDQVTYPEW